MSKQATNPKPLSKIQEMRMKAMKQKEDTINTVLTSAKNNPNFVKLLMYALNSLENFVSPPNREIRVNASVIIRLEGVGILHVITIKNIKNDEIVTKAGNILWKLISVYNNLDSELAKLFAEKNGHKAVIEILVQRQNEPGEVTAPYVRVLNGLVQIPQLVPSLLESGLADTINLNEQNTMDMITLNLDTLQKISNQKVGRDFLITKNFVEKIITNIKKCADKKAVDSVLCGLAVLDNLCRSDEGKKAIKDAGGIDCLSYVLDLLSNDDYVLKMCAKIYSKIATVDDMKAQIDLLKGYYDSITANGPDSVNYNDINKSLVLVSNFMLVDELGKQLQSVENFKILEGLFNEIQKLDLSSKDSAFLTTYVLINKYFMLIFYRLFSLQTDIYNKQTEAGKAEAPLIKNILDSIKKNFESVTKINSKELNEVFSSYFTSYSEILRQDYKEMVENQETNYDDIAEPLLYINNSILKDAQNIFNKEDLDTHLMGSHLLKISDEISLHEANKTTKKDDLVKSMVTCYPYLEFLFTEKDNDDILCNSLEVIFDLLNNEKEFFDKNIEQIIFKIRDFMNTKKNHRYPCLLCLKLLNMYLTPEYVNDYIKARDATKTPTHSIDYVECTVNVMIYRPKPKRGKPDKNLAKVEEEINDIGEKIIEKLIDELEFKNLLKEFCSNAESFEPDTKNKEAPVALEKITKKIFGVMSVIKFFNEGALDVLKSLKNLIEKEVKYIEFFKRDKENQKNPNFEEIIKSSQDRVFLELSLALKLCEISQQKVNHDKLSKALDVLFAFLSKSSDIENVNLLLFYFRRNSKFLFDEEKFIGLDTKEPVSEKLTSTLTALLRRLIEEESIIGDIIMSLFILGTNRKTLCNTMVKGGCPRLLFQVMETSPNEENVERALHLLKLISFSNIDNLTMVANQNAMIKFFETKNKFPTNQRIIDECDMISNEILSKIPGQEKYADELIKDAINDFNENAKGDFALPEVRQKILNNLEVINSFSTNQAQFDNLNKQTDFITNLKAISDKTFEEKNITQVIEKLSNNELSLLKKLNSLEEFDHVYTIDKLIDVIKNKSGYRDILLSSTEEFIKYLRQDDLYTKYLKEKVDNSFVDAVFDDIDNYLGDIKVSKELNNILCQICLRDDKLASYIKTKGGLANVLEELKSNINSNDQNSNQMKLNALKMLISLCTDKDGMDLFIKANGIELFSKIIENEADLYEDSKPNEKDLFKTRQTLNLSTEGLMMASPAPNSPNATEGEKKPNAAGANAPTAPSPSMGRESYIVYCITLAKKGLEHGYKDFINNKNIKNLLVIAEGEYPRRDVFKELCSLFIENDVPLPKEDKYVFLLLKECLSFKARFLSNKEMVEAIGKVCDKILPKLQESQTFLSEFENSIKNNKNDLLQLTYIGNYISQNDTFAESLKSLVDTVEIFCNDLSADYHKKAENNTREDIPEGVIISLMDLLLFLLKYKKEIFTTKVNDIVDGFLFVGQQYVYKKGHNLFSLFYIKKFAIMFDLLGKRTENEEKKLVLTPSYKKYLQIFTPRCVPVLNIMEGQIKENEFDYGKINKNIVDIYEICIICINDYLSEQITNLSSLKPQEMLNNILALIDDLQQIKNLDQEKTNNQYEILFSIIQGLLSQKDEANKEIYTNNDEVLLGVLTQMENIKKKNYEDKNGTYEKIMNHMSHNLENSSEIFEKITSLILDDFKQSPPKELDTNLDTLATQTKYSTAVKYLINNKELVNSIHEIYKDDNLTLPRRKNISTIFSNLMKNTYNVDSILEQAPDVFKTISAKLAKADAVIKEKENIDIPLNELHIIASVLKDDNSYKQIVEKKLITEDDLKAIVTNYKGVDASFDETIKELENILDKMQNKDAELQKSSNFKVDFAILTNLKKRIESAYHEHIKEVNKLNPQFNAEDDTQGETDEKKKLNKQLGFIRKITAAPQGANVAESTSSIKKRRLSVISKHLFFNPYNNQIASPISTKVKDENSTTLDSLLALIRLIYSNNKDTTDKTIMEQRQHLLKEAIKVLKMMSICPDNHKGIVELGLLNFTEKILSKKEENFQIYLGCLDILKNCTWSESAVLLLLDSPILDKLIEEIVMFYDKPETVAQSDEMRTCFMYDNILFSNICKCQKGFEVFFNKIGIEKLIVLGKNTGNIDLLTSIVEMLTNYLIVKKTTFNDEQLKDVVEICNKGFTLPDKSENLIAKTLKLTGLIYDDRCKEKIGGMNIVKIINDNWEEFQDEVEYFFNAVFVLRVISLEHQNYSDEVVESKLIDNIVKKITKIGQNDDLIIDHSFLLKNLMEKNEPNRTKLCKEEIFNNVLHYLDSYSPRIEAKKRGFSIVSYSKLVALPTQSGADLLNSPTIAAPPKKEEPHNIIISNLLRVLELLTKGDSSVEYITKNRFMGAIIDTIGKPNVGSEIVLTALHCLGNYFYKDTKSKWKHSEIEELFSILKSLQKEFYANSEILTDINFIAGYILKGYKSKLYTEKYYLLVIEGLNCQDWNLELVSLSLKIIKESLEDHEDLRNDIFEQTKQSVLNILRVYQNNLDIQKISYEILTIFAQDKILSFNIVNSDIMESLRDTFGNQDFNSDTQKRLIIRIVVFNLLNYLTYDDTTSIKVSYELMESFVKDLLNPNFTEDLNSLSALISTLFKTKQSIEPFMQYLGHEAIGLCLEKFYEQKNFILNCFKIIKEICFSSIENKNKLREIKIIDKINIAMEKAKPEDRIIKFEGKISITNINYDKGQLTQKPYVVPNYEEVRCIKIVKKKLYNYATKGIPVKGVSPKGKSKDYILSFSPDLMKIYLKRPKIFLAPPKPKRTIETPICTVVQGHGTDEFSKLGGILSKPPDKDLCFSIIQAKTEGEEKNKSLNIILSSKEERDKVFQAFEIAVYYMKCIVGVSERGKLCQHVEYLDALANPTKKNIFGMTVPK